MIRRVPYDPTKPEPQEIEAFDKQSIEERFLEGPRLFDLACRVTMDGIRRDFPQASAEDHRRMLHERVEQLRRVEGDVDE